MSNESRFQVVCINCSCLSIKIAEPLESSREAIVYCGDCGASRGTVGALRDLAVQGYADVVFATPSSAISHAEDEQQPATKISAQYAEIRLLRQQIALAESLAGDLKRSSTAKRIRATRHFTFRPSPSAKKAAYLGDKRDQKRPR